MLTRQKIVLNFQLLFLYIFVACIFFAPSVLRSLNSGRIKIHSRVEAQAETRQGNPVYLKIPKIGISLPVISGAYTKETWDLSPTYALFALGTAQLNQKAGNTLLYGHNTSAVFFKTVNLKLGDMLYVYADSGNIFVYAYSGDKLVAQNDLSIFSYNGPPQVTLLTCNGFLDQQRRLMFFQLTHVL